ncbi:MAG: PAS domain S-box protein [Verrucomicrobiota bacterium]
MSSKPKIVDPAAALRSRAERQVRHSHSNAITPHSEADIRRMLHELEIHQIELEMQNTELRCARDDAENQRDLYTDLYDFAPVGYFTLGADGTIRLVNLTGSMLADIDRSNLVGQPFSDLLSADLRAAFKDFLKKVFGEVARQAIDSVMTSGSGPPRFVSIKALRSPNGVECNTVVADITERMQVKEQMMASEIRYRRLFEAAHDGILLIDPVSRKITDANPFMMKLLGSSRERLIGKELFEIGLLKDEAASQEMIRNLKMNHDVRYEDLPLESQGGRHQEVEVIASIYEERGRSCIQCNIRDITERTEAENARRRVDVLSASNLKLKQEIVRRKAAEVSLRTARQELSHLLKQSRRQELKLRDLSHRIMHAQEEERKRISRELHDVVAQTLVGINVHLAALASGANANPQSLQKRITSTQELIEKSVDVVHRFTRELRPTMLDDLGLIPTLQTFLKQFMETTGVRVGLKVFAGIEQSTDAVRTTLFRIVQEALNNVASHAKASQVEVSILLIDGMICMEIKDDGQGFDNSCTSSGKKKNRLGLLGMRERVEMIGGMFRVESAPGQATTVHVDLPNETGEKKISRTNS